MPSVSLKPVVYIVTGAWHIPKHYQPLRAALEAKGFLTSCNKLLTCTHEEPPTAGLSDDTVATHAAVGALVDAGHPVIVVMHSYGGVVGTNSLRGLSLAARRAAGLPGGVVRLVYVAAFLLAGGTSLLTPWAGEMPDFIDERADGRCYMKNNRVRFFNDIPDDDEAAALLALCTNFPSAVMHEPLEFEAYREVPVAYMVCEEDEALPPVAQVAMAEAAGVEVVWGSTKAGHDGVFTAPKDMSAFLEKLWKVDAETFAAVN